MSSSKIPFGKVMFASLAWSVAVPPPLGDLARAVDREPFWQLALRRIELRDQDLSAVDGPAPVVHGLGYRASSP